MQSGTATLSPSVFTPGIFSKFILGIVSSPLASVSELNFRINWNLFLAAFAISNCCSCSCSVAHLCSVRWNAHLQIEGAKCNFLVKVNIEQRLLDTRQKLYFEIVRCWCCSFLFFFLFFSAPYERISYWPTIYYVSEFNTKNKIIQTVHLFHFMQ